MAPPSAELTATARRVVEASVQIAANPLRAHDLSFMHIVFTQVSIPRAPSSAREHFTTCGDAWIRLRAGSISIDGEEWHAELPSGALARLALAYINTYVVKTRSRHVPVAESAHAWLRAMGKSSSAAHADRARRALANLVACDLTIGWKDSTLYSRPIHAVSEWRRDRHGIGWPKALEVSADYAESLWSKSAVPLDRRALSALSGSALAMDIYVWLSYRLYRVGRRGAFIPWPAIEAQFGAHGRSSFEGWRGSWRRAFRAQLGLVSVLYGGNAVQVVDEGALLQFCPPQVPATVDKSCG